MKVPTYLGGGKVNLIFHRCYSTNMLPSNKIPWGLSGGGLIRKNDFSTGGLFEDLRYWHFLNIPSASFSHLAYTFFYKNPLCKRA